MRVPRAVGALRHDGIPLPGCCACGGTSRSGQRRPVGTRHGLPLLPQAAVLDLVMPGTGGGEEGGGPAHFARYPGLEGSLLIAVTGQAAGRRCPEGEFHLFLLEARGPGGASPVLGGPGLPRRNHFPRVLRVVRRSVLSFDVRPSGTLDEGQQRLLG